MPDDRNIATPHIHIADYVMIPARGSGAVQGLLKQEQRALVLKQNRQNMQLFAWRSKTFMIGTLRKRIYGAYSENKYRFAVKKKSSKVSYTILLLSDSTFFKLFFHTFAAIIEAIVVAGHKFLYTLLIECGRLRC